jgi:short-subunit dehydrogenase
VRFHKRADQEIHMRDGFERFRLEGRAALVTGGSLGLGYHMARGLLASGATVTIAGRRLAALEDAAERLRSESPRGEVKVCAADLSERRAPRRSRDERPR